MLSIILGLVGIGSILLIAGLLLNDDVHKEVKLACILGSLWVLVLIGALIKTFAVDFSFSNAVQTLLIAGYHAVMWGTICITGYFILYYLYFLFKNIGTKT